VHIQLYLVIKSGRYWIVIQTSTELTEYEVLDWCKFLPVLWSVVECWCQGPSPQRTEAAEAQVKRRPNVWERSTWMVHVTWTVTYLWYCHVA